VRAATEPQPHVQLGVAADSDGAPSLPAAFRLMLAQEIRSARGGHYTFRVRVSGGGSSKEAFQRWFGGVLACRLVLFRFANPSKNPLEAAALASAPFQPQFADFEQPTEFSVSQFLGSTVPGANFSIGNGLGVAVVIETKAPQTPAVGESAFIRLHDVHLEFNPRPRDENVTV
jgi:hypothetical protein